MRHLVVGLAVLLALGLSITAAAATPWENPGAGADALTELLAAAEDALNAEPPTPEAFVGILFRLRALEEDQRRPSADLLQRLEFQLRDLAFARSHQLTDPEWQRPRVRAARETLDALFRKQRQQQTRSASLGSGERARAELIAPPAGDECADAVELLPGQVLGTVAGANANGGASCGPSPPAPDAWYTYTATSDGLLSVDSFWSRGVDTILSIHSACPDSDSDHELTCNDDDQILQSRVGHVMTSGETVWLRVAVAGGDSEDFDLRVRDTSTGITGTVTEKATGEPLSDGWAVAYNRFGGAIDWSPLADDGSYLLFVGTGFDIYVKVEHPDFVDVFWPDDSCSLEYCEPPRLGTPVSTTGGLITDIDFALDVPGAIAGTVTSEQSGAPLRASVYIYRPDGSIQDITFTAEDGTYSRPLPKGDFHVFSAANGYRREAWDDQTCLPSCRYTDGDPVEVSAGQSILGIDFQLTLQGSVSGRVLDAVTGLPVAARVSLVMVNEWPLTNDIIGRATVEADGSYHIPGVEPGTYHLLARPDSTEYVTELYGGIPCHTTCPWGESIPVQVALSMDTSGIDFTIDRRGSIRGRVTNRNGEPVLGVVKAEPDPRDIFQSPSAEVQSDGSYELLNLSPGVYEVWFLPYDQNYENSLYDGLGFNPDSRHGNPNLQPTGTWVPVPPAATPSGIDFVVNRCSARHSYLWARNYLPSSALSDDYAYEACRTILVTNVTVDPWNPVVLRAGKRVILEDGFSVDSGARLVIEIDPTMAPE